MNMQGSSIPRDRISKTLGIQWVEKGGKRQGIQKRPIYARTARVMRTVTIISSLLEGQNL